MKEQSLFMKTVGKLESAVRWIVVVLLIIMVVDIITAVFFRYVLQNSNFLGRGIEQIFDDLGGDARSGPSHEG